MFSYLEDDNDMILGTGSHYRGPMGGSASFVDGSVSVFDGFGGVKLAGADSEEGREQNTEPEEPRSILTATKEYWDKMLSGTGEALSKGKEGAKDALSQTWGELTGNEELHKGVEFGVKAAGEVSKDVWKEAGADAASALLGYGTATKVAPMLGVDPVTSILRNRGWRMSNDGYDLLDSAGRRARDLGARIENLKRGRN